MIRIVLLCFALQSAAIAATGDILSPVVARADGWTAEVTIEGKAGSGTYDFGWTSRVYGTKGTGTFQAGETVTQTGTGATGKVWGPADDNSSPAFDDLWIYTASITGTPNATGVWTGGTSGATFTPSFIPVEHNYPARSNPKVVFTVVSKGYNASAVLTTTTRTVYGTKEVRKPYPDQLLNEESGSNPVTVRIALSDLIYQKDNTGVGNSGTAPVVNIASGFYTQGGGGNNATGSGFTVSNLSTIAYTYVPVVMNWGDAPYQRLTSTTKLRALAFHRHGTQGKPVAAVKFTVTDGTTTNSEIVPAMSCDLGYGDAAPVVEYVTTTDLSASLTQGAVVTGNIVGYPWVGDTPTDSSTGAAAPSPLLGPMPLLCDRTGGYGLTHAVVDPVNGTDPAVGSDSGKWVGNGEAHGSGSGLTPYLTAARAARAIRDYNNANRGRDDVGGGFVYSKAGTLNSFGATISGGYGSTPATWLTIKPFTGVTRDEVVITGSSGNTDISDRVKLENIRINTTTTNTFSGCLAMWLHNCDLNSTAAATWNSSGQVIWLTQGKVGTFTQGLRGYSTSNVAFALVRGVDLTGFSGTNVVYTTIGNKRVITAPGGPTFINGADGQLAPWSVPILAYNELYGYDVSSGTAIVRFGHVNSANPTSAAVVQNLIEIATGANGGHGNLGATETVANNTPLDNFIYWNNTHVGGRMQFAYNASGTTIKHRRWWSVRGNYWDISGYKTDTFTGTPAGAQGARVGNWTVGFGVGATDNVNGNVAAINTPEFNFDFFGLGSQDTGGSNLEDYPAFVDRRSYDGAAGLGVGDYHVTAASPLAVNQVDWMIPYDLDGEPRDANNAATGVYVQGEASSGGNFPVVTITSPANGATQASPVTFAGTATDTEDGTISSSIVWTSSIDGSLGTGASISPGLSTGTHTITATVTDAASNVDTDTITVTVSAPPSGATLNATRINADTVRIQ